MKTSKYILLLVCGTMAILGSSCKVDEPGPIPAEELFLRAFIKEYGLIDPNQDWTQAERKSVTIDVDYAKNISVYVKCLDRYYRVAKYADVTGEVEIPIDIPENTDKLYVDIDGRVYTVKVGETVMAKSRAVSRAGTDYAAELNPYENWDGKNRFNDMSYMAPDEYINCGTYFYVNSTTNHPTTSTDGCYITNPTAGTKYYCGMYHPAGPGAFIMSFDVTVTSTAHIGVMLSSVGKYNYELEPGTHTIQFVLQGVNKAQEGWPMFGVYLADGAVSEMGYFNITEFVNGDMGWLLVAEDLGTTDDFDFNDVIVRIKAVSSNTLEFNFENFEDEWWQILEDEDEHLVLQAPSRTQVPQSRANNYTMLQITPMCAGGSLDSYLHFGIGDKDFVLGPGKEYDLTTLNPSDVDAVEWHDWFEGGGGSVANKKTMLNTGLTRMRRTSSTTIAVPETFTMENYSELFRVYSEGTASQVETPWVITTDWLRGKGKDYSIQGFFITVGGKDRDECDNLLLQPKPGAAPQIFLIPDVGWNGYWHWPHERVSITNVYPSFKGWNDGSHPNWYLETPNQVAETKEHEQVTAFITR